MNKMKKTVDYFLLLLLLFLFSFNNGVFVNSTTAGVTTETALVEEHHSIFGSMTHLEPKAGAVSIVIIVVSVILVEMFFGFLNSLTKETPFEDMVLAIEKELMVVGCMAFVFKVIVNVGDFLPMNWFLALEYADVAIPVTSFCLCGIGLALILLSIKVCKVWIKAYHLHLYEILDLYYEGGSIWYNSSTFSFLPFSMINSEMEFRIFHSIFCDQYKIQRKAFAFDEYVHRKFEKFLLSILTIEPINWLFVIVLTLFNWLRMRYEPQSHCAGSDEHDTCVGKTAINQFTYFGIAMVVFLFILVCFSRYYELRLMRTRGVHSSDDYAIFLQNAEKVIPNLVGDAAENRRFNEEDLKKTVGLAKIAKAEEQVLDEQSLFEKLYGLVKYMAKSCIRFLYIRSNRKNDRTVFPLFPEKDPGSPDINFHLRDLERIAELENELAASKGSNAVPPYSSPKISPKSLSSPKPPSSPTPSEDSTEALELDPPPLISKSNSAHSMKKMNIPKHASSRREL